MGGGVKKSDGISLRSTAHPVSGKMLLVGRYCGPKKSSLEQAIVDAKEWKKNPGAALAKAVWWPVK